MEIESWREHTYYHFDPFAKRIDPALLNSADIRRYVDKGCLIEKRDFDNSRLKTASYELRFLGELYCWEGTSKGLKRRCKKIIQDDLVKIGKNSISYLWTEERLWLPEYIAARFNLHIRHVHRGILLGTGPLVDAGFGGSILIPLHNLTDRDYDLRGGEGVVWVEFTKLSTNAFWRRLGNDGRPDGLEEFPTRKVLRSPNDYFDKAGVLGSGGVQSAFKGALNRAEGEAKQARVEAEQAKQESRRLRRWNWVGVLAVVVALVYGSWTALNVVETSISKVQEANHRLLKEHVDSLEDRIAGVEGVVTARGTDGGVDSTGESDSGVSGEPDDDDNG